MNTRLLFLLMFLGMGVEAQKHDYNWVWGTSIALQDSIQYRAGNAQGDFWADTLYSYSKFRNMPFSDDIGFFSNEAGQLQLYSNGMQIMDTTGQVVDNGDSINFGQYWMENYQGMVDGTHGFPSPRGLIFISFPGDDSTVYLIHEQFGDNYDGYASRVKMTTLRRATNGRFAVTDKNRIVSSLAPAGFNLSACRHGNGRDWWILFTQNNTNCISRLLLTPDTLLDYGLQCIGDTVADLYGVKGTFSLNGMKYASSSAIKKGVNVFDFDRCSGELSNPQYIPPLVEYMYDSSASDFVLVDYLSTIDFSPDGRFIYLFMYGKGVQYDLHSPQMLTTGDTIAVYDKELDTVVNAPTPFIFNSSTYGPNGVLYLTPANYQRYLYSISNPNGLGASCDYRPRSVELPKVWSFSAPNIPNYRLGSAMSSVCDTLTLSSPLLREEREKQLKLYPNPANDFVTIDYGFTDWSKGTVSLEMVNALGQTVYTQALPQYSGFQKINIAEFSTGLYQVFIKRGAQVIAVGKFVKE